MPKRTSKEDVSQVAARVVAQATHGEFVPTPVVKNPAAVMLGRLGGLKGGPARAASMSAAQRKAVAKKAAAARWARE